MTSTDAMPVFVLKGKDALAPAAIEAYRSECHRHRLYDQAGQVDEAYREMARWQHRHPEAVKLPDHKHIPATVERPQNVPPEPHAQDGTEHPADAARRFAGELGRIDDGLRQLGIIPTGPVDAAAVDTALRELASANDKLDAYQFAFREHYASCTRAVARWRAADPKHRAIVWPAADKLLDWLMAKADQAEAANNPERTAQPLDIAAIRRRAHADGYAEAVARLRDDERYRNWWSTLPQEHRNWWSVLPHEHPDYGYWQGNPRRQIADYLETVADAGAAA